MLLLIEGPRAQSERQGAERDLLSGQHLGHKDTAWVGEELSQIRVDVDTGVAQREKLINVGAQNRKDGTKHPHTEGVDWSFRVIGRIHDGLDFWVRRVVLGKLLWKVQFRQKPVRVLWHWGWHSHCRGLAWHGQAGPVGS